MITRADWQAVNRELMAEQRARLGEPPTADELLAYMRGELSESDEESMRERLAAWPELARSLAEPFPEEPDATMNAFTWGKAMALAAMVLLLFGGLLWRERNRAVEPQATWEQIVLLPDAAARGVEPSLELQADTDYVLVPSLLDERQFAEYRIDLRDLRGASPRELWSRPTVRRDNDTLVVYVPGHFLKRGRYQLAVYGISGSGETELARYTFRVP